MNEAVLEAIAKTLAADPENGPLWRHYAELLAAAGRKGEAADALVKALDCGVDAADTVARLVPLLREVDRLSEAMIRAEAFLEQHESAAVRLELARVLLARGDTDQARVQFARARALDPGVQDAGLAALAGDNVPAEAMPATAGVASDPATDDDWLADLDWDSLQVTFKDVAGLDAVKRQIQLRIIAPFEKPELYRAFGRKAGGGILLYGPPGCGKTYLARATAGELGARFVSVGIHELVDKWWGESEKLVHGLFERAWRRAPTVLFFDEFDALGAHRGRSDSQFWKTLVNQMLQEMDGVEGDNDGVLVFAATNMPWGVDAAFRRPGRFDRIVFVPPPDLDSRTRQLEAHLAKLPGGAGVPARSIAARTELFSGADLRALCEEAAERALEKSLASDAVHEIEIADFERVLANARPSTNEWIATARNHARYSNDGGQYDELADFLKKAKRW